MAVTVEPLRRRLTVSQVAEAANPPVTESDAPGDGPPQTDWEKTVVLGLTSVHEYAHSRERVAFAVYSVTDSQLKKKPSYADKDFEYVDLGATGMEQDAMYAWVNSLGIGWCCRKGLKPESPNQDSFSVLVLDGEFALYCVYDGHGPSGHVVSDYVRKALVKEFVGWGEGSFGFKADPARALRESFVAVQTELEVLDQDESRMSGTTVTMMYHDVQLDMAWIAHVGDSRAIISTENGAQDLTVDHKPNLEEERRRIEAAGGRVVFDGFYNHRVFAPNGMYPGLNMSRALGDVIGHKEAGLVAFPDVKCLELEKYRKADKPIVLLLCTDGVWEFINGEEALRIIDNTSESMVRVGELAKQSWDRWMEDSDGEISDDITGIMVTIF